MFLDLPEDLTVALLSEWLESSLIDLSHLDVACCSHASRSYWLHVLRQIRPLEDDATSCNSLAWLHNRDILMHTLRVRLDQKDWKELSKLSLSFRTTSLKCLQCSFPQAISTLLAFFPCLTSLEVDCGYWNSRTVVDLPSPPSLRRLSLQNFWKVKGAKPVALLLAVCATLEEFYCNSTDKRMVQTLTAHCTTLKKLNCFFHLGVTAESIKALCSNNSQLAHVEFNGAPMSSGLILSILAACPWIRDVVFTDYEGKTSHSGLLSSNLLQGLDMFRMWPFEYNFSPCESGHSRRCCEIVVHEHTESTPSFIRTLFTTTSFAIRGFTLNESVHIVISANSLRLLVDAHGDTLEKCELCLFYDVNRANIQDFLSRCPNMMELTLTLRGW